MNIVKKKIKKKVFVCNNSFIFRRDCNDSFTAIKGYHFTNGFSLCVKRDTDGFT